MLVQNTNDTQSARAMHEGVMSGACTSPQIFSFFFLTGYARHRAGKLSLIMFLRDNGLDQLALPGSRTREVVVRLPCAALTCGHFFCSRKDHTSATCLTNSWRYRKCTYPSSCRLVRESSLVSRARRSTPREYCSRKAHPR